MELPRDLKNEVWNYCMSNDITNIDDFVLRLIKQGFTIEKFGISPSSKSPEKILEPQTQIETLVQPINQIEIGQYIDEINKLKQEIIDLNSKLIDCKKNKKDLYGES